MTWKKSVSMPKEEKVVSTVAYGGYYYWDFEFPFRHYKEPKLYIATETAIYTYEPTPPTTEELLELDRNAVWKSQILSLKPEVILTDQKRLTMSYLYQWYGLHFWLVY